MAKPRKTTNNRPEVSKGTGDRADVAGGEGEVVGKGGKKRRGSMGNQPTNPPPPRRDANRHREGHADIEGEEETEEEEEEEEEENKERDRDGETPRVPLFEVTRMGGTPPPPQRKTQTSQDSP